MADNVPRSTVSHPDPARPDDPSIPNPGDPYPGHPDPAYPSADHPAQQSGQGDNRKQSTDRPADRPRDNQADRQRSSDAAPPRRHQNASETQPAPASGMGPLGDPSPGDENPRPVPPAGSRQR